MTASEASLPCMRNTTHQLLGVTLALGALRLAEADPQPPLVVGAAAGALFGSWLPDVDQPGARLHRRSHLERRSLLVGAAGALARLPLLAFSLLARHRAITHSLAACLAVCLAAALAATFGALAFAAAGGLALGYAAHVLADACTRSGVSLWAPFSARRVWLLPARARVRTASLHERLLAAPVAVAALTLLVA